MTCKINLKEITTDDRNEYILHATHEFIAYTERNHLILASCSGEKIAEIRIPANRNDYQSLETDDNLIFIFAGTSIVIFDKSGMDPMMLKLDPSKTGKCITKIFTSNDQNKIIFGTSLLNQVQFVNYDFVDEKRISQTASWKMSNITNIFLDKLILYAVLDGSIIVCCDMSTGETLWTRFETGRINRGIFPINGKLYYTCQGLLKYTDGDKTEAMRIPQTQVQTLEAATGNMIYFTANKGNNVCQYNISSSTKNWEVFGQRPVEESVLIKSTKKEDVLLVRTENNIAVLNLVSGKAVSNIKISRPCRLVETHDHVIVQKENGSSVLLPGE